MKGSARAQAATTVDRILRTGAYSNVVTAATSVSPPTDHPFYQRLVYTVLRHLPLIDRAIAAASSRPLGDVDAMVLSVLRVATAECLYLGTKPHAVVHEAVETARVVGRARASGYVNAVMRSVVDRPPMPTGAPEESYPAAVIDAVVQALGEEEAARFLSDSNQPAPVGVRGRDDAPLDGRYLDVDEDLDRVMARRLVDVIDPASVAVAAALAPEPGDRILDMAAAPGGKTRAIADAMRHGHVVAMDRHRRRLLDAAKRSRDHATVEWVVGDGRHPPFGAGTFDRILVDAPCSGLGTMRRRPEIRHRFEPESVEGQAQVQRAMVESAMRLVRPGGVVVYSVCTVTVRETLGVVDGLGFRPPPRVDGAIRGDGVLLAPHTTATDGMFIARYDAPAP